MTVWVHTYCNVWLDGFNSFVISGDLMFHLNRILFSPHLKTIVTWEVTLFLIIKFLYKLVAMINSTRLCTTTLSHSSVKNYHKCFLKDFCTFETAEILTQIQREFIQIWMCLLLWQICILFGNFSSIITKTNQMNEEKPNQFGPFYFAIQD